MMKTSLVAQILCVYFTYVNYTPPKIGKWKYIVAADLTSAFYQVPLSHGSRKYCSVATPFQGIQVYARSAMVMPSSETDLEELLYRILGDLVEEGIVATIADDLYLGGLTPRNLLNNLSRVLQALGRCDLCLSAK